MLVARMTRNSREHIERCSEESIGVDGRTSTRLAAPVHGQKQWLAARDAPPWRAAELLLVDEPVSRHDAAAEPSEPRLLLTLAASTGRLVEHDMDLVRSSPRVTVLHEGSVLAEGDWTPCRTSTRHRGRPGDEPPRRQRSPGPEQPHAVGRRSRTVPEG